MEKTLKCFFFFKTYLLWIFEIRSNLQENNPALQKMTMFLQIFSSLYLKQNIIWLHYLSTFWFKNILFNHTSLWKWHSFI